MEWSCQYSMYWRCTEEKKHLGTIDDIPERGKINNEEMRLGEIKSDIVVGKEKEK